MVSPDPRGQNPCSELGPCREDVRGCTPLEVLLWKQCRKWKAEELEGAGTARLTTV